MPIDVLHKPDDGTLRFSIKQAGAEFNAKLAEGKATGTLQQGGMTMPVTMEALADDGVVPGPRRPQTPLPPFPYDVEEVEYESDVDGCKLAGTLTMPRSTSIAPAVLLLSGSGAHDRDETIFCHKPFLVLADELTRRGIAVLRVDDRGIGGSGAGTAGFLTETFAADAVSGMVFLRRHARIDDSRVGLLGHSEGGLTAAIAAATSAEQGPAFIALLAGPGLTGRETLLSQNEALFKGYGASQPAVRLVLERLSAVLDRVEDGSCAADIIEDTAALVQAQLAGRGLPSEGGDDAVKQAAAQFTHPWMRRFVALDPCEYLAQVRCPVLAVCGTKDVQVIHDLHLPRIEAAVRRAGAEVVVVALEGHNHLLQRADTGMVDEYAVIEETISAEALCRICDWFIATAMR